MKNNFKLCGDYAVIYLNSPKDGDKECLVDVEDLEKIKNIRWYSAFNNVTKAFYVYGHDTRTSTIRLHRLIVDAQKALHSSYLFYTMEVDKLNKQLQQLKEQYMALMNRENFEKLQEDLKPFQDEYFKDLSMGAIAELAKKSIRLGKENRELEREREILKSTVRDFAFDVERPDWIENFCNGAKNWTRGLCEETDKYQSSLAIALDALEKIIHYYLDNSWHNSDLEVKKIASQAIEKIGGKKE